MRCHFIVPAVILLGLSAPLSALAATMHQQTLQLPLDNVALDHQHVIHISNGIGSGAYHVPGEPENWIYTITDRGPNIKCKDAPELLGQAVCDSGKIFPLSQFAPAIYHLEVGAETTRILSRTTLKRADHRLMNGLSLPDTEPAYDVTGAPLPGSPDGVDSEALVMTQAGDFYVSDEYGPSILHLAHDGTVLERWYPAGIATQPLQSDYPIKTPLPAIIRHRHLNRGIEALALSPDENYLYFMLQSPLDNPDKQAFKHARNVRLFKLQRRTGEVISEYVYRIDKSETFAKDNTDPHHLPAQRDVKISEMAANGKDQLIILERMTKTTKFYQVDLRHATPVAAKWDKQATTPSLEQTHSVPTLSKTLLLNSIQLNDMPEKIEGMAYVSRQLWYLITDNDFGNTGAPTHLIKINFAKDELPE